MTEEVVANAPHADGASEPVEEAIVEEAIETVEEEATKDEEVAE